MHGAIPREIELTKATPGMTLAAAVLDDHGAILLPEGALLSSSVLASLRKRGLRNCLIWTPPCDDGGDGDEAAARALARLDALFRNTCQDEANMHLLELLRAYHRGTLG